MFSLMLTLGISLIKVLVSLLRLNREKSWGYFCFSFCGVLSEGASKPISRVLCPETGR